MKRTKTRLALLYNLRKDYPHTNNEAPEDVDADWDIPETISYLQGGLHDIGYDVIDVGYDSRTPKLLPTLDAVVFNICEMHGSSYREALVPSLCELLHIPYVFSTPDVMLKTLDKNLCNFLVHQLGINVPPWVYIKDVDYLDQLNTLNDYPYIVKPAHEGSGIGISSNSVVHSSKELYDRVELVTHQYKSPVLVQKYIEGTELTIGVTGNLTDVLALKPIEVSLHGSMVYGYEEKENSKTKASYAPFNDEALEPKIKTTSINIYNGLGCRDAARIDFRLDRNSMELYFLEINPLPHLHPQIGDFCRSGAAAGYSYQALLSAIMDSAMKRV